MSTDNKYQHYICSFDVKPKKIGQGINYWSKFLKEIRAWISKHNQTDDDYGKAWFFNGGNWSSNCPKNIKIQTKRLVGNGDNDIPEFWTIVYTHNCQDYPNIRFWKTEIGITSANQIFRFNLELSHSINYRYMGEEPHSPNPTTPAIVKTLLTSKDWDCFVGNERLSFVHNIIKIGQCNVIRDLLSSEKRHNPVILVSKEAGSNKPLIDSMLLARRLAGLAFVYELDTVEVQEELEWILGDKLCCKNGMVRVYQDKVDFDNPADSSKHRFFAKDKILSYGQEKVIEMIVHGVQRRCSYLRRSGVFNIEDINRIARERRIQYLKKSEKNATENQEYYELIESENGDMEERIKELNNTLDDRESYIEKLQSDMDEYVYRVKDAEQRREESDSLVQLYKTKATFLETFKALPSDPTEVLKAIQIIHYDKIVITEDSYKTVKKWDWADKEILWKCLWSMATILHGIHFKKNNVNTENEFNSVTEFILSLNESPQTDGDKNFRTLRTIKYNGKDIYMPAHVKKGKKGKKVLRIHYDFECEKDKIVIGHCGNHLETFSSKSKK